MIGAGSSLLLLLSSDDLSTEPLFQWAIRGARFQRGTNPINAEPFYRVPGEDFVMRMPLDGVLAEGTEIASVAVVYLSGHGLVLDVPFIDESKRDVALRVTGGLAHVHNLIQLRCTLTTGEVLVINGPIHVMP